MTKKELNSDCRRLILDFKKGKQYNKDHSINEDFKNEFMRIYYADSNFEYLTEKNALKLMRINLCLRLISLHFFGISYEV